VGTIGVQLAKVQKVEVTGVDRGSKHDMMRRIGFDHVIDYETEDFTQTGQRYDLILDTKTSRSPSQYARSLSPGGTYATVGGLESTLLLRTAIFGWWSRPIMGKSFRLIALKQKQGPSALNERFEAGQLMPAIDGPYRLSEAREAFRISCRQITRARSSSPSTSVRTATFPSRDVPDGGRDQLQRAPIDHLHGRKPCTTITPSARERRRRTPTTSGAQAWCRRWPCQYPHIATASETSMIAREWRPFATH